MVLGIDLIKSFLVDEEIAINWNDHDNWSVVEHFLFDALLSRTDAIVRDLPLGAILDLGGTIKSFINLAYIIAEAGIVDKSINFCIVESP